MIQEQQQQTIQWVLTPVQFNLVKAIKAIKPFVSPTDDVAITAVIY